MAINLVDGRSGRPHIDGSDLGEFKAGVCGGGGCVLKAGDMLKCTVNSANSVTIGTGSAVLPGSGRHVRLTSPETLTVESGTQGKKRNDLVVLRPTYGDVESCSMVVLRGEPSDDPLDPEIEDGDMPLYRLPLDGVNLGEPVPVLDVLAPLSELRDSVSHAGRMFSGDLGRLPVDGAGHIRLWTNAEFERAFGAEPKDCLIAASNRASGTSGIFLSSPRWNGDAVFVTQMAVADGAVKPVPGDGATASTPVAYLVAVY